MKAGKIGLVSLLTLGLLAGGNAHAALTFWVKGDLMIIYGKAEAGDPAKLKEKLTPAVKNIVLRSPSGTDWSLARDLAEVVSDAHVTTVVHGYCGDFVCPMIFLSGDKRMFSGVDRPELHYLSLWTDYDYFSPGNDPQITYRRINEWWRAHTKIPSSELQIVKESWLSVTNERNHFSDSINFFPVSAKFSRGNTLRCFGSKRVQGKSQYLIDCTPKPEAAALTMGIVTTNDLFTHPDLREPVDVIPPVPTNVAKISDAPIAALGENCRDLYKDYLRQDSPKAFVVSQNQGCRSSNAQWFRPYKSALEQCQKNNGGAECRFYAIDNDVVFTPFDQALPATPTKTASHESSSAAPVLTSQNTSLLLARGASKEDGPSGVAEKFTVEGKILAYLTFKWDSPSLKGTRQEIEVRWLNADKVVSSQKQELVLSESSQHIWQPVLAADIGTGKARVEIYAAGNLIATKSFTVVEHL